MSSDKLAKARAFAAHLQSSRSVREEKWRELSRWLAPHRALFDGEDMAACGERRNRNAFTQMAQAALLRGASGLTSGMTPRNISWFKPDFQDVEMSEASGARAWLDEIDRRMKEVLAAGGFYQAIHAFNTDLLWAGCALIYSESSDETVMQFECVQIGSFGIALDGHGKLDAAVRAMNWTVERAARTFGKSALSQGTQSKLEKNPFDSIRVWHLVRPRDYRNPGKQDAQSMPYESLFWEDSGNDFLHEGGYNEMPYFFAVWHESANPYGTGPGDDALPDARQVDMLERRKLEGLAKLVNPPVMADFRMKQEPDLDPGGLTWLDPQIAQIRPILDLSPYAHAFQYLQAEINTVGQRLEQELMASIFASMPLDQRPRDMSATEFLERKREALQQMGPVMSAYEPNVLTPLLHRLLATLDRAGLAPPPPPALEGYPCFLKMDFISPMANALRQTGAETTRALMQDVAMLVQTTQSMDILDKVDVDQMVDELATGLGVPGKVIRADSDVAQIRQQRAEAQAAQMRQQQQMIEAQAAVQNAQGMANAAKTVNEMQD